MILKMWRSANSPAAFFGSFDGNTMRETHIPPILGVGRQNGTWVISSFLQQVLAAAVTEVGFYTLKTRRMVEEPVG
jgi:hypothetical protein